MQEFWELIAAQSAVWQLIASYGQSDWWFMF